MPNAMPTPDEWERDVIRTAQVFTTFIQIGPYDRRRTEHLVDKHKPQDAYAQALAHANAVQAELQRPVLIYAVNAAGRQAVVTPRQAQMCGLLP